MSKHAAVLVTLLFLAYGRITTAYLYATEMAELSYLLVYAEPIIIGLLLLLQPQYSLAVTQQRQKTIRVY